MCSTKGSTHCKDQAVALSHQLFPKKFWMCLQLLRAVQKGKFHFSTSKINRSENLPYPSYTSSLVILELVADAELDWITIKIL